MVKAIQFAFIGLLLSAAALCGFGCWAVWHLLPPSVTVVQNTATSVADWGNAGKSTKVLADNLNTLVVTETPQIDATLGNLVVTSTNLKATSVTLRTTATQMSPQLVDASNSLAQTASNLETATAGIDASVAEFNRKCHAAADDCGTLAGAEKAIHSIRMAAGQITAFSEKEDAQRKLMNDQETDLAKKASGALTDLDVSLQALSGIATDTQQAWHKFLHPKWPARMWGAVKDAGLPVLKIFF